jgi:micrococcal nuclease
MFSENNFVTKVIDGDTIDLSNRERVRFIGIDAPDKGERCYYEATEKLKELILNQEVNLESDVGNKDTYGRSLRYIYLGNSFINLEMIKDGYAYARTVKPNVLHSLEFADAEESARKNDVGCLWE